MRSTLLVLLLAACNQPSGQAAQKSQEADHPGTIGAAAAQGSGTEAYKKDIETLCESMTLSGASKEDPSAHQLLIANFLAANLHTEESRKYLVKIQPLNGEAKAKALDDEATRLGLTKCSLSAEWRKPPAE